jgi:hypothetical protein
VLNAHKQLTYAGKRLNLPLAALLCLGLGGCAGTNWSLGGAWDDITARDWEIRNLWGKQPDPLVVLRDSNDGDKRAKALRALREPAQYGGTKEEQDAVVTVLCTAVQTERQAWCRQAAISSLRTFKDPRAAEALVQAYYAAAKSNYPPETVNIIHCQVLEALGEVGNPAGVQLLLTVVKEPPVDGPDQDQQQKMSERIAAARALRHFKNLQAAETLVAVLKTERDPALRDRAHESLQIATGKRLPADAQPWEEYLHTTQPDKVFSDGPGLGDQLRDVVNIGWWWK